jgi:hypothetical protein
MKVMSTYTIRPGCTRDAVSRFLAGKAQPPAGVKILGRWHKADASGGYTLFETDSPATLYEFAASWSDVLETHSNLVIEDAEAGPILAKVFK